jgi:aspartate aminotransferase
VAKKYKTILLSDEIYGELHHKGKHVSIARYYPEGTIISGGLSKWCGAGGWRLGTFVFPSSLRWLIDAIAAMASETFTSTSAPIQYAAVRAFRRGSQIEKYLWRCRWILEELGNKISKELEKERIIAPKPDGAFYLFLDFENYRDKLFQRDIKNSTDLCKRLLEDTGVAILPGQAFGMRPEELTARLAYVDISGVRALNAAMNLDSRDKINGEFLDLYCPNVLKAISLIKEWIKI